MTIRYRFISEVSEAVDYVGSLSAERELALDLEADSLYSYPEKVCLIQISTRTENTVLDSLAVGAGLGPLGERLADEHVMKVFHGGGFDIRLLKKAYGFKVTNVVDTMIAAQLAGRAEVGLSALLEDGFGLQLQKKYQRANWSRRPLPTEMLQYAALDTAYLLPLWTQLRNELLELDRVAWAMEEFELLEAVEPAIEHQPCWFDIKGARDLEPGQCRVLQALLQLREQVARSWNRPPFKVLGNEVLLRWARDPPACPGDVLDSAGASRAVLRRLLPRILQTLQDAQHGSPATCPIRHIVRRPAMTGQQRRLLSRLKRVRQIEAERLGLDPGLVVTSATLASLARTEPSEARTTLQASLKRWQYQVLGDSLYAALRS